MHLHTGGAVHLPLQYFMPRHQPQQQAATRLTGAGLGRVQALVPYHHHHHLAGRGHHVGVSPSASACGGGPADLLVGVSFPLLEPLRRRRDHGGAARAPARPSPPMPPRRPTMRLLPAAGEHVHGGHAWSQQHDEQSNSTCYRENFLDLLASKNVTQEMFDDLPAGHYAAQALSSGRFGAGSDVVAPIKFEVTGSPLFFGGTAGMHQQGMNAVGSTPCYAYEDHHQMKEAGRNQQQQELSAPAMTCFLQQLSSNNDSSVGMHASLDYSGIGVLDKICQESSSPAVEAAGPFAMRSLPDLGSFGGYRSTTPESTTSSVQPYARSSNLSDSSNIRQEQDIVSARSNSSGSGAANDRKKRPSEERASTGKKSKQDGSKASPPKQQVPKVKIGEKITALQQIVSPFGKTDTASVLFETIKYIKFLHEQVQVNKTSQLLFPFPQPKPSALVAKGECTTDG
ncbi:hypothetical protein BS78_04G243500 [Paspalum vaginatum]|nr:hypothetical protein BS78_04G243500 [Paspalum vaginatum]